MLQGDVGQARQLRRDMSLPEVLLWQALRLRPAGHKFRRQHPADRFTPDFYCHRARLVIEVDGEAHGRGDRPARDAARDAWFAARGIDVLRITAADVLHDLNSVVDGVVTRASWRDPEPKPRQPRRMALVQDSRP